jgi:NhaA family Na+:H+ antiporter
MKVKIPYLIGGVIMWWFMLHSGSMLLLGILLAFVIPFGNGDKDSTSSIYNIFCINRLVFYTSALCFGNTAIVISSNIGETISQHYSIGIALGLIVGKPLGSISFSRGGLGNL